MVASDTRAVQVETATIYRTRRRRFLSKRSAYLSVAGQLYWAKYGTPRSISEDDYTSGRSQDEDARVKRVIARLAWWLAWRDSEGADR